MGPVRSRYSRDPGHTKNLRKDVSVKVKQKTYRICDIWLVCLSIRRYSCISLVSVHTSSISHLSRLLKHSRFARSITSPIILLHIECKVLHGFMVLEIQCFNTKLQKEPSSQIICQMSVCLIHPFDEEGHVCQGSGWDGMGWKLRPMVEMSLGISFTFFINILFEIMKRAVFFFRSYDLH